jgi:hypothetical protein
MNRPELCLWWEVRDPSRSDDARRLSQFVTGLPDFDPIYQSWLNSPAGKDEAVPVPLNETAARRLLIDNIDRSDFDGSAMPEFGSNIWGGHAGPPPYDFSESNYAETSCHVGSYLNPGDSSANHILMGLSALRVATGRPWRASELRPMMKFAREIWSPTAMCVMFPFYMDFPSVPIPLQTEFRRTLDPMLGWITYLPADLAARAKYPADVEVETLSDGAVLVTLCEEMFEETDAEGMKRLHALEAALRPIQS